MADVVITPGSPHCDIQAHETHAQKGEPVEWTNKTDEAVGIEFKNESPFTVMSFTIPANGAVSHVVREDAETKKYPFLASCQVGPPGPPGIIVDPPN